MPSAESDVPLLVTLVKRVNDSPISSIKTVVTKIIEVVNDPSATPHDLRKAIEIDPPLTTKVLRTANSAFYHHPDEFYDLTEAIIWIGFDTVAEMALHHKVSEIFQQTEPISEYSRIGLWKHSTAVAHCLKLIYRREFEKRSEKAYIVGLLHNIGIIIEDQFLHEHFSNVLKYAAQLNKNLQDLEQHILGYTHADIGAAVFKDWAFPNEMCIAVEAKYHPDQTNLKYSRLPSSLYVADAACQQRDFRFAEFQTFNKQIFETQQKALGIKPKALELIMDDVENEMQQLESEGWFHLDQS